MENAVIALGAVCAVFTLIGRFNPARNGSFANVVTSCGRYKIAIGTHAIFCIPKIKKHVIISVGVWKGLEPNFASKRIIRVQSNVFGNQIQILVQFGCDEGAIFDYGSSHQVAIGAADIIVGRPVLEGPGVFEILSAGVNLGKQAYRQYQNTWQQVG